MPSRVREGAMEHLEELDPLFEQDIVGRVDEAEAVDERADYLCLERAEAPVLQVQIVYDRRDMIDRVVSNRERADEGLERAAFRVMRELDAEHVERNGVARHGLAVRGEREL